MSFNLPYWHMSYRIIKIASGWMDSLKQSLQVPPPFCSPCHIRLASLANFLFASLHLGASSQAKIFCNPGNICFFKYQIHITSLWVWCCLKVKTEYWRKEDPNGRFQKISIPYHGRLLGFPKGRGGSRLWNSEGMGVFTIGNPKAWGNSTGGISGVESVEWVPWKRYCCGLL